MKNKKYIYIETYGCQMNFSDTDIVISILANHNYLFTTDILKADVIFLNTCSIRDHAEKRVINRLQAIRSLKKKKADLIIGVLGCMAERLKEQLLDEKEYIDLIVGPDAYRDLPKLIEIVGSGEKGINVILSAEETYADINPVRINSDGVTAFISIMRGCQNFCAYCVVPNTRGVERSRDPKTISKEASELFNAGYREVTLLGQNVNSYKWKEDSSEVNFAQLIESISQINPKFRVRFATSHPKDLSDELLATIKRNPNICKCIHLPLQSGSNRILKLMNRKYDREYFMDRVEMIRKMIPDCSITTDIISGFCSETNDDHNYTLDLMKAAQFDYAFMFKYSERPGTLAAEKYSDDVAEEIKSERLKEIIDLQQHLSLISNKADIGKTFEVLIEKNSKRSKDFLSGRNTQNKMVVFPSSGQKPGQYAEIAITRCTAATLIGELVNK